MSVDSGSRIRGRVVVLPVRFNFLHRGHEAYIASVLAREPRKVYIFLGRSNGFRIPTDPLDDVERRFLVEAFLQTLPASVSRRVEIFPVFNRQLGEVVWTREAVAAWYGCCRAILEERGLEAWDAIVSGNPYAKLENEGLRFVDPYRLVDVRNQVFTPDGKPVCATYVRALLYSGDDRWRDYVAPGTASLVERRLAEHGMDEGPREGVRHRLRFDARIAGRSISVRHVVRDGEFKDHALVRELGNALRRQGLGGEITGGTDPYRFHVAFGSPDSRSAMVRLDRVSPCPETGDLDYHFSLVANG